MSAPPAPALNSSPARNTRSQTASNGPPPPSLPPAHVSPKTRRRKVPKTVADLSDEEAWSHTDEAIIAASVARWTSPCYNHYTISLARIVPKDGAPRYLEFVFNCKTDPENHTAQKRKRPDTSHGTGNLGRSKDACLQRAARVRRRLDGEALESTNDATQTSNPIQSPYDPAKHRTIIAIRCAKRHRPVNMVEDPEYAEELDLLRPGTQPPSASTVARDIETLHVAGSARVKQYFEKYDGVIHVQADGWQAPLITSFMGIVIMWYDEGKIWRAVLEFCRLTMAHTGDYQGDLLVDLLDRFGLRDLFFAICQDNATVCDRIVRRLSICIPSFPGMKMRLRCWAHIINLIAKAFIALFFETPPKPAVIRAVTGKRKHGATSALAGASSATGTTGTNLNSIALSNATESLSTVPISAAEAVVPADEDPTLQTANEERALFPVSPSEYVDPGRVAHDVEVVTTAVSMSEAASQPRSLSRMVPLTATELDAQKTMAIGIFPKVAGLARRVHDSSTVAERFNLFVGQDRSANPQRYPGTKTALDRRVPTRWNSDLAALRAHIYFEGTVKRLINETELNLKDYALTDKQWTLAKEVAGILQIFEAPTRHFSQKETPLIHEVLPMMEMLIKQLKDIHAQNKQPLHEVTVLAARAALVVAEKYYRLALECDVYEISLVLCPDRRLSEFRARPNYNVAALHAKCVAGFKRFDRAPQPSSVQPPPSQASSSSTMPEYTLGTSIWVDSYSYTNDYTTDDSPFLADSIEAYLAEPLTPKAEIVAAGGLLAWWAGQKKRRPNIARMALAYLTAPATSVDAERAFSEGRLSVNHLQHNLSSNAFRAKVALGSWYGTPLLPSINEAASLL